MADINVERKRGGGMLPWILGLLALLLLIWLLSRLLGGGDDEPETTVAPDTVASASTAAPVDPAAAPVVDPAAGAAGAAAGAAAAGGALAVAQIAASPQQFAGQTVSGTARVTEVVADHGFWVEENGQRMFVAMGEAAEHRVDIQAGQTVMLNNATVHTGTDLPQGIDAESRQIASQQPAFVYVRAADVQQQGQTGGA